MLNEVVSYEQYGDKIVVKIYTPLKSSGKGRVGYNRERYVYVRFRVTKTGKFIYIFENFWVAFGALSFLGALFAGILAFCYFTGELEAEVIVQKMPYFVLFYVFLYGLPMLTEFFRVQAARKYLDRHYDFSKLSELEDE